MTVEAVRPVKGALILGASASGGGARSPAVTATLLRAIRSGALVAGAAAVAATATASTYVDGGDVQGTPRRDHERRPEPVRQAISTKDLSDAKGKTAKAKGSALEDSVLDIGVDSGSVRRSDAPPRVKYGRGELQSARKMLKSRAARIAGTARLLRGRFAPTTRRTRISRTSTLKTLVREAGLQLIPITVDGMYLIAAALKEGGYRTGASYLSLWESLHKEAGHGWSSDLAQAKQWARKSMERGMGPSRRAATVVLESMVAKTAACEALDFVVVGAMWMMRGAELAGLLVEQASVALNGSTATMVLGAHKTNVEAGWCERSLRCCCKQGDLGRRICPVHALDRVLARRRLHGSTGKQPLFPGKCGRALTHGEARAAIRMACKEKMLTEHSLRRMGAQLYARRGVSLPVIQFLGRWGSSAVERYVAEALAGRAAWAPLVAATELDGDAVIGTRITDGSLPGYGAIARTIASLVKAARRREEGQGEPERGSPHRVGGGHRRAQPGQALHSILADWCWSRGAIRRSGAASRPVGHRVRMALWSKAALASQHHGRHVQQVPRHSWVSEFHGRRGSTVERTVRAVELAHFDANQ